MSTFYIRVLHFTIASLYTVINTWPMQPPLARSILVGRGYNLQEFDTKYDKDHSIFTKKMLVFLFFDVMVKYCYAHMCILKQSI